MTYLELINKVLVRLRENKLNTYEVDSNPYFRSIGAHVNDAKEQVENSWDWSQLRDIDSVPIISNTKVVTLPDSAAVEYKILSVLLDNDHYLRWATDARMKTWYVGDNVNANVPWYFGFAFDQAGTGNKQITIYPPSNAQYTLNVERVRHQDELVNADDKLLVPSLPVYTLATALASRERGEVGGTPTSELFAIADRHLSDAIAFDSARFPEELDWYSNTDEFNTNVRNA